MTELYAETGQHTARPSLESVTADLEGFLLHPRQRRGGAHARGEVPPTTTAHVWEANGLLSDLNEVVDSLG